MENFTPLKTVKKKRKINKFLVYGSMLFVFILVGVTAYLVNTTKIKREQKAYYIGDCQEYLKGNCLEFSESVTGYRFFCPQGVPSNFGCSENLQTVSGKKICFQHDCGTEQIDLSNAPCNFISN